MIIGVPSGIGDISWVVSKLITTPQWNEMEFVIADGWPFRAGPYLTEMLGRPSTYSEHVRYDGIIVFEKSNPYTTWADVLAYEPGIFWMQPNSHLERGMPLRDWLPDLSTDYHYNMNIPNISEKRYYRHLTAQPNKWIGISAASYRGHKAWKTWDEAKWREMLEMLLEAGYNLCFMGGSWDDLTRGIAAELLLKYNDVKSPVRVLDLVGQTSFPEACAVHKMLIYYIGYSSGLGIIRTVMSLPTMMLWPDHQVALSESWADPSDIQGGVYLPLQYIAPKTVANIAMSKILEVLSE